jgi:rubrerythrin
MPVLTPTKATGGTTKALPGIYAEPQQLVTDQALAAATPETGLNEAFLADLLSAMLTHERCGRHLYRSCEARTHNPVLQAKYREFGAETEHHVEILEAVVTATGGNTSYVGPAARAVEGTDSNVLQSTFMLRGSVDPMTAEMVMLDAVLFAECMDHANWQLFSKLATRLPAGSLRDQFEAAGREVEPQEDEHLTWATTTKERLAMLQASDTAAADITANADEVNVRVQNWLAE